MNRNDLHEYQKRMVQHVLDHAQCALFAECGLGKSITTLTAIADLIFLLEVKNVLIVAPLQVARSTWAAESEKWKHTKHLRVSRVLGTEKQRIDALNANADIYVIGRDSFVWLVKFYKAKMPFDMLVIDELTSFKSSTSQRFKALRLVRSQFDRIVGLTGTPAPNGYIDLWAQLYCLDGGERLGKYKTRYLENYFSTVMSPQHYPIRITLRPLAKERIEELISDICISMRAEDYLTLPPLTTIPYHVQLPDSIMRQYRQFERDQLLSLVKGGDAITAANAAALMGKLSQFCNGAIYDEEHNIHDVHDEKVRALVEIIEAAQSPVLVFYQYKHDVPRIQAALKGYKVEMYENDDTLHRWNDGKIDVLLAHPASTAYGLNMQAGGHTVAWFGTGFNAELYQQAIARLHRQGQQHAVRVYQLLVPNTVDEKAVMAVNGKIKTQDALMDAVKQLINKYNL